MWRQIDTTPVSSTGLDLGGLVVTAQHHMELLSSSARAVEG